MNKNQKHILIAVIVVVVAMLIYPPFQAVRSGTVYNMGYGWIFALSKRGYMTINVSMLIIQWIGVFVVGGLAFFLTKNISTGLLDQQSKVLGTTVSAEEPMNELISYAGFWKRVAAWFIDLIILLAIMCIFAIIFFTDETDSAEVLKGKYSFWGIIITWLYYALMESSAYQGTIGKMFLGIKVIDLNGHKIGFGRATGRHFSKFASSIILCIGFIIVAFTKKKQGLHDIMAGCLVVTCWSETSINENTEIKNIIREAETRSVEGVQSSPTYPVSSVKQQNEEFIELLKSSISENGLNTIPGDDLIKIYNRARSIVEFSNEQDMELLNATNMVLEEIRKRGLVHQCNVAEREKFSNKYEEFKDTIINKVKNTLKTKEEMKILDAQSRLPYPELIKLGSLGQLTDEGLAVYELLIKEINKTLH